MMRKIDEVIIHCSATREGQDISVDTVRQWHLDKGWADIGYHFFIDIKGEVHIGRDIEEQGAHTFGHNHNSIGVCYAGGVEKDGKTPKDTRTEEQENSLVNLLTSLKERFKDVKIHGHRDFSNKACPSFDATTEYKWISNGYCKCTQEEV